MLMPTRNFQDIPKALFPLEMISCYKIRNTTGNFSTGGMTPRWTKRGKVWSTKGAVMCHLAQFEPNTKYYSETDMVVCTTGEVFNVIEEIARLAEARKEKDAKREIRNKEVYLKRAEENLARAKRELARLKE